MKKSAFSIVVALAMFLIASCAPDPVDASTPVGPSSSTLPPTIPGSTQTPPPSTPNVPRERQKLAVPQPSGDTFKIPNSSVTLNRSNYYTDIEEVAPYVMAFKKLPGNFCLLKTNGDRDKCKRSYGKQARMYKDTYHNDINGGYNSPYLTDGASKYYEADMTVTDGTQDYDPQNNRGAFRIVFSVDENHEILYYTDDHYDHFSEYYNYCEGWGNWFGDNPSEKHPSKDKWIPGIVVDHIDYSRL